MLWKTAFGVSAAAAAVAAPAAAGDAAAEEKTEFDVVLKDMLAPTRSLSSRSSVRLTGLGLKEAKEMVDSAPEDPEGSCLQGRRREDDQRPEGSWRNCRNEVIAGLSKDRTCRCCGGDPKSIWMMQRALIFISVLFILGYL